MDLFDWIKQELAPESCTSDRFIYDDMESQSGRSLPLIYQPFDASVRWHWGDRGSLFEFLFSTDAQGKKVLDFGPGDGWPSLIVAPFVGEVVGVDGSRRRVEVCTENACRMGIANATFIHSPPGQPLPFEDESFDAVMAASSVEQTPDPKATLCELYRVLRPGGRLRIHYEALGRYRKVAEREAWFWEIDSTRCHLFLYDRQLDQELVWQVRLTFSLSERALRERFGLEREDEALAIQHVTVARLEALRPWLVEARALTTRHPSGRTWAAWLSEVGFGQVEPTHSGAYFAVQWFDQLPLDWRPTSLEAVDDLLRPAVKVVVQMAAPLDFDPPITAVKMPYADQ